MMDSWNYSRIRITLWTPGEYRWVYIRWPTMHGEMHEYTVKTIGLDGVE